MTTIDYKVLFEVRVLHDYYLYGPVPPKEEESRSFFAMDADAQEIRLQALTRRGRYDIRNELQFLPGSIELEAFRNCHLRMIETATGFYIATEVKLAASAGVAKRFRPAIVPSDDVVLTFGIAITNPAFEGISSLRLDRNRDTIYSFSNEGDHDGRSLAKRVGVLDSLPYRMGDLAIVGGTLHQAMEDNNGAAKAWTPVAGSGFVNQADLAANPDFFAAWSRTVRRPAGRFLGAIRIGLNNGNGDFSPLTPEGLLTTHYVPGRLRPVHPVFELRFLSLSTYWRYYKMGGFSKKEAEAIQKNAGTLLVRNGEFFETRKPRNLARELPPLISKAKPHFPIPNAEPGSLRAAGGRLVSEVQLNYVPTT